MGNDRNVFAVILHLRDTIVATYQQLQHTRRRRAFRLGQFSALERGFFQIRQPTYRQLQPPRTHYRLRFFAFGAQSGRKEPQSKFFRFRRGDNYRSRQRTRKQHRTIRKEEKRRSDESEERPFQQLAENGTPFRYGG